MSEIAATYRALRLQQQQQQCQVCSETAYGAEGSKAIRSHPLSFTPFPIYLLLSYILRTKQLSPGSLLRVGESKPGTYT